MDKGWIVMAIIFLCAALMCLVIALEKKPPTVYYFDDATLPREMLMSFQYEGRTMGFQDMTGKSYWATKQNQKFNEKSPMTVTK